MHAQPLMIGQTASEVVQEEVRGKKARQLASSAPSSYHSSMK
jgi:hypothetical protein